MRAARSAALRYPAATNPSPPASDTAAARAGVEGPPASGASTIGNVRVSRTTGTASLHRADRCAEPPAHRAAALVCSPSLFRLLAGVCGVTSLLQSRRARPMNWVHTSPPQEKDLPMSKLVSAIRRTLGSAYSEPPVHFHQGTSEDFPEVCYDAACRRP